jgi:citrate synthase
MATTVIDIRTLGAKTGLFTYDSGFLSTASCKSKITFIDGDKGELLYRGYPIEQLAENCDFLEVAYLLKNGELPNVAEDEFENADQEPHDGARAAGQVLPGLPPRRPPDGGDGRRGRRARRLLPRGDRLLGCDAPQHLLQPLVAKLPTIVAMAYKYNIGQPFMYPAQRSRLYGQLHAHDVRHAVRGVQAQPGAGSRARHASLRCTPTTSRMPRPRRCAWPARPAPIPFACISAGIACLWGPAHGGANEACLQMLEEIGDVSRVGEYIKRAKDKNDSFKLMGFGHRVYKNFDPRAKLMRKVCARGAQRTRPAERPPVQAGHGTGEDRPRGRVLRREEALPERRLLLRHRAEGASAFRPRCSPASSRWPAPSAG